MYDEYKVYGPYLRKDGRMHIIAIAPDGKRKTVSYPKFLVENYLDRYLSKDETVDHIDGNYSNNNISNLQILSRSEHIRLDVKRYAEKDFICPICNKSFSLSGRQLHDAKHNRKKDKSGPFCSRQCAGKYGKSVQLKERNRLCSVKVTPEYTNNKSSKSLNSEMD